MKSIEISTKFSNIELALTDMNWKLTELKNGVFTFIKDNLLLRFTPSTTHVIVVGNNDSVDRDMPSLFS